MNFKALESEQKLTGAYYTPPTIAHFITKWVMEASPNRVLEPSCGDGVFIDAVKNEARANNARSVELHGVDIDGSVVKRLTKRKRSGDFRDIKTKFTHSDFLEFSLLEQGRESRYDAVIGNPPFIRYQYLDKEHQNLTERIFQSEGLKFTKHTNAWVPFVIQSLKLLTPGGRLGMVVPTELMHVLHANSLRQYLIKTCQKIAVVHVEDLFSKDVLQGVVLLLCEKKAANYRGDAEISFPTASRYNLHNGHVYEFIKGIDYKSAINFDYKWTEGLLDDIEQEVYQKAKSLEHVKSFKQIADADVGMVTGANNFFLVSDEVVKAYNLQKYARPMFGRSSHARGMVFSDQDIIENREMGLPVNFIEFPAIPKEKLTKGLQKYVDFGEEQELHTRYKCRIRSPWYVVPSVWASEVSMLKRAHNLPRLIYNKARSYTTDTAYRITIKKGVSAPRLVWNFVNSLTALSGELEGRHYGGGVIELVPSEIERLTVPYIPMPRGAINRLDKAFRKQKDMAAILRDQDAVILHELGLTKSEIKILHNAWTKLKDRRQRKD